MRLSYKVMSLVFSALGGLLAGAVFKKIWKVTAREDDAPDADDQNRSWREVLIAAALQGAIFGLVKATVQRAGAQGVRRTTGRWPGDE
jgi:predicted metal-dependent enzyme (double-stranded beta helix superfamily)